MRATRAGSAGRHHAPSRVSVVRIGTWNVAYGVGQAANRLRIAKLGEIDADVWVLTETHRNCERSLKVAICDQ